MANMPPLARLLECVHYLLVECVHYHLIACEYGNKALTLMLLVPNLANTK